MFLHASLPAVHKTHSTAQEDQQRTGEVYTAAHTHLTREQVGRESGCWAAAAAARLPDVERCAALITAIMTFYLNVQECSRSPRGPKAVRVRTTLQTNKEVNTGEK